MNDYDQPANGRTVRLVCILLTVLALSGCAGAAISGSTLAVKSAARDELRPKAEAGDAVAQYELGSSYCCMGPGFDTQTATEWFCRAALQGNADAMHQLGRIYMGDVSRTMAPGQKLLRAMSAKKSVPHAHLWLSQAADMGHEDAGRLLAKVDDDISSEDLASANRLTARWPDVACEYNDVFVD